MALESFFLMGVKPLFEDFPTWKLHQLIDWEVVSHKLKGLYRREETHGGGKRQGKQGRSGLKLLKKKANARKT